MHLGLTPEAHVAQESRHEPPA